jgi:hypothetical protein
MKKAEKARHARWDKEGPAILCSCHAKRSRCGAGADCLHANERAPRLFGAVPADSARRVGSPRQRYWSSVLSVDRLHAGAGASLGGAMAAFAPSSASQRTRANLRIQ